MKLSIFSRHIRTYLRHSSCLECYKSSPVAAGSRSILHQVQDVAPVIGKSSSTFVIQGYSNSNYSNIIHNKHTNGNYQNSLSLLHFLSKSSLHNVQQVSSVVSLCGPKIQRRLYTTDDSKSHLPPKSRKAMETKEDAQKSPINWKTLAIVAGICGVIAWTMNSVKKEKETKRRQQKQLGKPALGGPWKLTDMHGKLHASEDFHGQWILIYFGFTNCPDICPDYVEKIVDFISKMDADKNMPSVKPLFITVDPDRDTPEILQEYLAEFSPKLLGLTGTMEEVTVATRAYRVYFSAGPKDEYNDYIVDHSIISYLVGPDGNFVDYFGQNKTAEEMFNTSRSHVIKYNKNHS